MKFLIFSVYNLVSITQKAYCLFIVKIHIVIFFSKKITVVQNKEVSYTNYVVKNAFFIVTDSDLVYWIKEIGPVDKRTF